MTDLEEMSQHLRRKMHEKRAEDGKRIRELQHGMITPINMESATPLESPHVALYRPGPFEKHHNNSTHKNPSYKSKGKVSSNKGSH